MQHKYRQDTRRLINKFLCTFFCEREQPVGKNDKLEKRYNDYKVI